MKFVKTAVAVAIAGIAAAPMIASAETTLSGLVQVKYAGSDAENADVDDPDTDIDETSENDFSMQAGDIRVGVVSEHELNSGLTGYGSILLTLDDLLGEVAGSDGTVVVDSPLEEGEDQRVALGGTVKADNIYVGLKGGFGDVRFGEIPLAVEYGQLANDVHDVGGDVGDGASYTGTFGPASVIANFSTANANDSDMFGAGVKFNFAGATIGLGFEDRDEGVNVAAGVSYAIAGVSLAAHYWAQESDFSPEIDTTQPDGDNTTGFDIDDRTAFAVQAGYAIAGVSLGLTYSVFTPDEEEGAEESVIRFDAKYDLGGGLDVSTRINNTSLDADDTDDVVDYRLMLTKNF